MIHVQLCLHNGVCTFHLRSLHNMEPVVTKEKISMILSRSISRRLFTKLISVLLFSGVLISDAQAQSGLRESLERLDVNENGSIDLEEITSLARPYLERITQARRMPMDRPMPIDKLQEAARIYYALQNGVAGTRVIAESKSTVMSFGADNGQPVVPEFGLAEVRYPYTQADIDEAEQTLRRYDRNKDDYIDRSEADNAKWTHRNPFNADLNKDDRLSRLELAQRYARRRLMSNVAGELGKKAVRTGNDIRPSTKESPSRDESQWWRQGGSSHWLTASMMSRFDLNKNGRLEFQEAQQMGFPLGLMDVDRDGEVTKDELHALLLEMQEQAGDLTEGLPGWFYELDLDKDGQIAMYEFATEWTIARHEQFDTLDLNGDGLLTSTEVLRAKSVVGGTYRNETAEVLAPHRTVISEIEVADDFVIRDLNVQISITHSHSAYLDGYLTGPAGQRIELFAEVGGGGDHFDQTVFDDESSNPVSKGRSPFNQSYRPQALDKGQPGLKTFNGTRTEGVWQLVIRGTRSDRFGMLHSWGMSVTPAEEIPDAPTTDEVEVTGTDTVETNTEAIGSSAESPPKSAPPEANGPEEKPPAAGFKLPFRLF